MEAEEMAKNVDACYKNILEKFNPGARQLINAGKSYLKALHGAAAAAKIYLESLSRVAKQAQQGTCGGTSDIGLAMQQMIDVQREIQNQQINTLKAFYVDLIVPLESNIEKDTKVVQTDHKKFSQQYRSQYDVYTKALTLVKKHGKKSATKSNRSSASYDKEIKHLQFMEEEKAKLDAFCEQSLKEAIAQERKRYGFVLERQTSLAKHFLAHYGKGAALLEKHLDSWQETSKAREDLPACVEFLLGQQSTSGSENLYALPRTPVLSLDDEGSDNFCSASQMRKSQSVDPSYLYEEANASSLAEAVNPKISAIAESSHHQRNQINGGPGNLSKSKSEYNLAFSSPSQAARSGFATTNRPKSMAVQGYSKATVRALYAYLSSGEHQISFLEGDLILLLGDDPDPVNSNGNGDRNKGWHYGENIRTGQRGWFPLAYTTAEGVKDADVDSGLGLRSQLDSNGPAVASNNVDAESTTSGNSSASNSSSGPAPDRKYPPAASSALMRPNSILFSKVPGFGKLRKSRSAFADRLLCPAATPSAPPTSGTVQQQCVAIAAAAGTPTSSPSALMMTTLPTPTNPSRLLLSTTASSPTRRAPAPPPRLAPLQHHLSFPIATTSNATTSSASCSPLDVSLRSSSDSGFANELPAHHQQGGQHHHLQTGLPPPAPEIDYSDEDSLKLPVKISRSLGDVAMSHTGNQRRRPSGLTMTLDRPSRSRPTAQSVGVPPVRSSLSRYPPVLGYLATLTRSKASLVPSSSSSSSSQPSSSSSDDPSSPAQPQPTEPPPSSGRMKLAALFTKSGTQRDSTSMATKIKSKMLLAPGNILKTALFRSRSKDSFLDSSWLNGSSETLSPSTWQHKSSVPCYVGWRPPMPLPKDCSNFEEDRRHRPRRRPSRLNRRMFSSESDLLDVISESGYMAVADTRTAFATKRSTVRYDEEQPRHTLPRHKVQLPESPRVQFKLDTSGPHSSSSTRWKPRAQLADPRRFCSPWSDLWDQQGGGAAGDSSVRLCEIAHL